MYNFYIVLYFYTIHFDKKKCLESIKILLLFKTEIGQF